MATDEGGDCDTAGSSSVGSTTKEQSPCGAGANARGPGPKAHDASHLVPKVEPRALTVRVPLRQHVHDVGHDTPKVGTQDILAPPRQAHALPRGSCMLPSAPEVHSGGIPCSALAFVSGPGRACTAVCTHRLYFLFLLLSVDIPGVSNVWLLHIKPRWALTRVAGAHKRSSRWARSGVGDV